MNILFVSEHAVHIGGIGAVIHQLCLGLKQRGHRCYLYTNQAVPVPFEQLLFDAIAIGSLAAPARFTDFRQRRENRRACRTLGGILQRWRIDLVHCHEVHRSLYTAGLVANCAIIASSHGGIFHKRYRKQRVIRAYRRFADKVSCVTVLNTAMADALQQRFGSLFAAEIIPNGIEDSWLAAPPERQKDILLCAGRLSADKCYDLAIDAYAASQSRQHLALVIAGEGDTEAELEARASAQQLAVLREMPTKARANTVYFSGYQTGANKMELFARARLLLHPSRFEAFGIVLLEAMAQKALPVCADLPTYRSQFAADRFHLQYITPYEVQAWARGIDECGDAAELAAAVAANHSAVAAFAWSRIFQRYLACYQAAAAGP